MSRRAHIPNYRLHKQSGQAVVTLTDATTGSRRDVLLGKHDTPESRAEYLRVITEWETGARRLPPKDGPASADLSLNEVSLAYWNWAVAYYRWDKRGGFCLKGALRVVKELYGHTQAREFGPLALKACRNRMITLDWSRNYINAQVDRIRRMFRWAAEEEMLPSTVYQGLKTVAGLSRGKSTARETKKVKPVSPEHVDATLPYLPLVVQTMVRLQLIAGCRPSEVCMLRPVDLDMRNPLCWVYQPEKHKTENHDIERLILIGPRAQEVVRPYLTLNTQAYLFSPRASEAARHAERRQNRKTPLTPSQRSRQPKKDPKRSKRARYDETSYRNAVYRACDQAFPPPEPLAKRPDETAKERLARLTPEQQEELKRWRSEHRWHPNRLRHTRATELRPYGLDLVKTVLGHNKVETTQIYAEKDIAAAMELVSKIG